MQKTRIKWPWPNLYVWNPVVGCKMGCPYCYAKKFNARRHFIPTWEEPVFYNSRLNDPLEKHRPKNIFVCSMADLFGEWICKCTINKILSICDMTDHHTYFFLTKNPARYIEFEFPLNCWLGWTVTNECGRKGIPCPFYEKPNKKFLSIEPLLGRVGEPSRVFDQVIVGAMTGPGAVKPKREWVGSIKHTNIYYKESITKLFPEFKNKG